MQAQAVATSHCSRLSQNLRSRAWQSDADSVSRSVDSVSLGLHFFGSQLILVPKVVAEVWQATKWGQLLGKPERALGEVLALKAQEPLDS